MADSNCADCFRKVKDGTVCICHMGTRFVDLKKEDIEAKMDFDPTACYNENCNIYVPGGFHKKGTAICAE